MSPKIASLSMKPVYGNFTTLEKKRGIPKSITFIFFLLAFVAGFDLGFTKSLDKRIRIIAKLISLMISFYVFFVSSFVLIVKNKDTYWMTISFLTFSLNFLVITFSKYNIYDFILDIHKTDSISTKQVNISVTLWLYLSALYLSKWALVFLQCEVYYPELCDIGFVPYYAYCIPVLALDWMYVVLILIYCYIYYCIKDIHAFYEKDRNISKLKKRYLAVAKCYDKIRPLYEKLIIVAVCLDLPKMMGLLYNMLKYFIEEADLTASMAEYTFAFQISSNIIGSGAMVQLVERKVNALIVSLLDEILEEKDATKVEELTRVVEYLKARQLWHPLIGVVPVDMHLPAFILSVCSTYLIVIIQFTHLVD